MGNIKVLIATANFGGIDEIREPVHQVGNFKVKFKVCDNLPNPKGYTNRMLYKYAKTHFHLWEQGYDIYIWIDGRVEITSPEFCDYIEHCLSLCDFVGVEHPERDTLEEEYEYLRKNANTEYLKVRYEGEDFEAERISFSNYLSSKLYNARLFAFRKIPIIKEFMQDWWEFINTYTIFDQTQYSVLLNKYNRKHVEWKMLITDWNILDNYTVTHKHIKNI
jgi:hypothetical protein